MIIVGLWFFCGSLLVHNYFSHEIGWTLSSLFPLSLEAQVTAVCALGGILSIILGILVAIVGEDCQDEVGPYQVSIGSKSLSKTLGWGD
jgi:hypothetical protein